MPRTLTDLNRFREGTNLFTPGKKPIGPVRFRRDSLLRRGLCGFVMAQDIADPSFDMLGNSLLINTAGDEGLELVTAGDVRMFRSYEMIGSSTSGFKSADIANRIAASDDVTVLSSLQINSLSEDQALLGFGSSQWSWLDESGGQLRVSAFTTYDTTTPITTVGRHMVGLIWRANNAYQTIVNGKYSQSGTNSRQAKSGDCCVWTTNVSGGKGFQSDTHNAFGDWWGIWNRVLSPMECELAYRHMNRELEAA